MTARRFPGHWQNISHPSSKDLLPADLRTGTYLTELHWDEVQSTNTSVKSDVVTVHQAVEYIDCAGSRNGCIFRLVPRVPTMAFLLRRRRDAAQGDQLAPANHCRHPLCFHRPRPFSANHVTGFRKPRHWQFPYSCSCHCTYFDTLIIIVELISLQSIIETPIITDGVLVREYKKGQYPDIHDIVSLADLPLLDGLR